MVETSFASITKPSIPEFSVKFVDRSYDVPTTSSIDPYTGQSVIQSGYHIENYTIDVTIKNQPFTTYYDAASTFNVSLYYNVRMKGQYTQDWMNLYSPDTDYPKQSNSEYTVLSFVLGNSANHPAFEDISLGAHVDFQVQALIGYVYRDYDPNETIQILMWPWVFSGETSGWNSTQTITIGASAPTATPNTSPSPTASGTTVPTESSGPQTSVLFGLDWIQVATLTLLGVIAVLLAVVVVYLRKRSVRYT